MNPILHTESVTDLYMIVLHEAESATDISISDLLKKMYLCKKSNDDDLSYLDNVERDLLRRTEEIYRITDKDSEYWIHLNPTPKRKKIIQQTNDLHLLMFSLMIALSDNDSIEMRKRKVYYYVACDKYKLCSDILSLIHRRPDETIHMYQDRVTYIKEYLISLMKYAASK